MHNDASGFGGLVPGVRLGPLAITVGAEANERFWLAAGCTPRPVLYPPIAAQLAIMLTRAAIAPDEVLHAGQWLRCERTIPPGTPLVTTGTIAERYDRRGRDYVVVETETTEGGEPVWHGRSTFCALGGR